QAARRPRGAPGGAGLAAERRRARRRRSRLALAERKRPMKPPSPDPKDPLVLFMPSGKRGRFPVGTNVLEAARQLGVYVESVCGGRATCGRCQVEVQEGSVAKHGIVSSCDHISAKGPKEERYGQVRGLPEGRRLSCSATVQGDLVVDVPQDTVINA